MSLIDIGQGATSLIAPRAKIDDLYSILNVSLCRCDYADREQEGRFDWLKKVLAGQPYEKQIAWRENEDNEFDARDLISLLTCFNTELFPNDVSDTQPVVAYEKKSAALKLYENNQPSYERMAPIVNDILRLHDTIRSDARSHWNDEGGAFGKLAFVETRKKGFYLPFDGKTVEYRLMSGAVYPILAAFRWMVDTDPKSKKSRWRGGFASVKALWQDSAVELLKMTKQASDELGRNPNAIGKSRNHWANLFARVAMRDLTRRMNR